MNKDEKMEGKDGNGNEQIKRLKIRIKRKSK